MSYYNPTAPSSPPLNVMVTSIIPASLMVSWQPLLAINHNGVITGYVIIYTEIEGNVVRSVTVNSGTRYVLSGLVPYVDYSVIVAAINVNGTGPFNNPVIGRSGEDSKLIPYVHEVNYSPNFLNQVLASLRPANV